MADNVQPDAGEQREESSSGLLLSVDPLQGTNNYKLAGDDGSDSDKGGLLGDDASDSDGSDSDLLGGDDDGGDASDSDGTDKGDSDASDLLGGDSDGSDSALGGDASDADASDAADAGSIVPDGDSDEQADEQMNPLGIADTNVDGTSTDNDGTDSK
jgi:hypothetical protein